MTPDAEVRVEKALRSAANGDMDAYAKVAEWCSERLLAYCGSRLQYDDVRSGYQYDLMNEVLHSFWIEINQCLSDEKLTCLVAWYRLRRVAKSLACDHYRAKNAQKRRPSYGIQNLVHEFYAPSVDDNGIFNLETIEERDRFLSRLSDRDRKLLELRRAGVCVEIIASELHVGSSTIYSRLRALENSCFEQYE